MLSRLFKREPKRPKPNPFDAMWRDYCPPITRQEHLAAKARLNEPPVYQTLRFPDGSEMQWITGTVDLKDYTRRDGYRAVIEGCDRFGWPEGHPDSPATNPQEGR